MLKANTPDSSSLLVMSLSNSCRESYTHLEVIGGFALARDTHAEQLTVLFDHLAVMVASTQLTEVKI